MKLQSALEQSNKTFFKRTTLISIRHFPNQILSCCNYLGPNWYGAFFQIMEKTSSFQGIYSHLKLCFCILSRSDFWVSVFVASFEKSPLIFMWSVYVSIPHTLFDYRHSIRFQIVGGGGNRYEQDTVLGLWKAENLLWYVSFLSPSLVPLLLRTSLNFDV